MAAASACGRSEEPANNVVAENDMNAMMADPDNPFASIEMRMHDAMTAAVGTNGADTWVRKMIEHHEGAVEMSRLALTLNPGEHVAQMAQSTIDKQGKEIADLEKLVASGNPDPASAELYRAAETQMHDMMMAAKGANLSETFHRKMLEHHMGAVALSDIALANGATGAVRAQIEKTRADQQKEAALIETMLRGEPMAAAPPTPTVQSTSSAPAKPEAPKAAPKPAPPALAGQALVASSRPADGATVAGPVSSVELHFSRPARLGEVTIASADGTVMPMMVTAVGEVLDYELPLSDLGLGRYSVDWKATAQGIDYWGRIRFEVR